MKYITTVDGKEYILEVIDEKHVIVNGKSLEVDFESVSGQPVYSPLGPYWGRGRSIRRIQQRATKHLHQHLAFAL